MHIIYVAGMPCLCYTYTYNYIACHFSAAIAVHVSYKVTIYTYVTEAAKIGLICASYYAYSVIMIHNFPCE